ncbi:hypothetical protein T23_03950 [Turicibacter faecis]|uniref:Type VII secretion system protein EssD-like domain-containing protein n=1 Tax=Turicibacter faecis TaxID=2963365 RepID=A0ABM8ILN6_9FIRM|nr:hypothetical protein T23_03950 [Turicibacter sp. TC023]
MIETMMSKVFEQSTESLKKSFDLPNFFNNDCSTTSISNFKEADKPLLSEGTSLESNSIYRENGQSLETDDNGNVFKNNGEIMPDTVFKVNGYEYETDYLGRTIRAEGRLELNESPRKTINEDNVGGEDRQDTDDRGHLIADRFGGSNKIENLVPMDSNLNRGEYKKIENFLADAVSDGKNVDVKVEPIYEGDSRRPSSFDISYSINGEERVTSLLNERSTG